MKHETHIEKSKAQKRRSPDIRNPRPRPMREGELDRQIVELVYKYRILSQEQIARLLSRSSSQVQRLLRRLYDHQYLERVFMPVSYFGAPPTFYILDREGRACLIRAGIEDFSTQPKKRASGIFIYHTNALNEARISIEKAADENGMEIVEWRTENELKQDYDRVKIPPQKRSISLIPDSYFMLRDTKGETNYFIELDRGTMSQKRFLSKVAAYIQYYKQPQRFLKSQFEKRYGYKSFRVLTIVDGVGQGRVENLVEATATIRGAGRRFWYTHLSDIQEHNPLTDPVWLVSPDQDRVNLLD